MAHIAGTDRTQAVLLPEVLDDYVTADNPVRFLDAFVAQLDLSALGFQRAVPAETGLLIPSRLRSPLSLISLGRQEGRWISFRPAEWISFRAAPAGGNAWHSWFF